MKFQLRNYLFALLCLSIVSLAHDHHGHHECGAEKYQTEVNFIDGLHETDHNGRILQGTYNNLRIAIDYTYFTAPNNQTEKYIKELLIPGMKSYFEKTLKVKPLTNNITSTTATLCGLNMTSQYAPGGSGISADLLVFVTGANSTDNLVAWARPCSLDATTKRPVIGQVNYNWRYVLGSSASSNKAFQSDLSVTLHEFTHVLVFSGSLFAYYINPSTNAVLGLNNVINYTMVNGNNVSYFLTTGVNAYVKDYFNCTSALPLLENQGSSASIGIHWERRTFMNEYMTASAISGLKITNLTFALFVDSGWYQVDYSMAESIDWGRNRGCDFLFATCIINNVTARFPEFCAPKATQDSMCSYDGISQAYCGATSNIINSALPPSMNYWGDNSSVTDSFADNCPYRVGYSNANCQDPAAALYMTGEFAGEGGRCYVQTMEAAGYVPSRTARCFKTTCAKNGANWVLTVWLGTNQLNCTSFNQTLTLPSSWTGSFVCPDPVATCISQYPQFCPRGCLGNGNCTQGPNDLSPKCVCNPGFAGSDCSNRTNVVAGNNTNPVNPPTTLSITGFNPSTAQTTGINYQENFNFGFNVNGPTNTTCDIVVVNSTGSPVYNRPGAVNGTIQNRTLIPGQSYNFRINCTSGNLTAAFNVTLNARAPSAFRIDVTPLGNNTFNLVFSPQQSDTYSYRIGFFTNASLYQRDNFPGFGNPTFIDSAFNPASTRRINFSEPQNNGEPRYIVVIIRNSAGVVSSNMTTVMLYYLVPPPFLFVLDFQPAGLPQLPLAQGVNYQKEFNGQFVINASTPNFQCNWRTVTAGGVQGPNGTTNIIKIREFRLLPGTNYNLTIICNLGTARDNKTISFQTRTPPSAEIRAFNSSGLPALEVLAINQTITANGSTNGVNCTYRFAYFKNTSDVNLNDAPDFGLPLYLQPTFTPNSSLQFNLPNQALERHPIVLAVYVQDSFGLIGFNTSNVVIVVRFIPANLSGYLLDVAKQTYTNSADMLKAAQDAQILLQNSSSNDPTTISIKNDLTLNLINTNKEDNSSNTFTQTAVLLKDFTKQAATVSRTVTEKVVDYFKDQLASSTVTVDSTNAQTFVGVLSNSLQSLAANTNPNNASDSDKERVNQVVTLTDTVVSKFVVNLVVGETATLVTDSVKIQMTKTTTSTPQTFTSSDSGSGSDNSTTGQVSLSLPSLPSTLSVTGEVSVAFKTWTTNPFSAISTTTLSSGVYSFSYFDDNGELKITGLTQKLELNFTVPETNGSNGTSTKKDDCSYWNTTILKWANNGCTAVRTIKTSSSRTIVCQCDHLTDFAVSEGADTTSNDIQYKIVYVIAPITVLVGLLLIWAACTPVKAPRVSHGVDHNQSEIQPTLGTHAKNDRNNFSQDYDSCLGKFCFVLKNTHNLFSIFNRDDEKLTKTARFLIYLIRWYVIFIVTAAIYYGIWINSFEVKNLAYVFIIGLVAALPVQFIWQWCLARIQLSSASCFNQVAFLLGMIFGAACVAGTFIIVSKTEYDFDIALMVTFALEVAWDIVVNQVLKVIYGFILTCILPRGCCRKTLLAIMDQDIPANL